MRTLSALFFSLAFLSISIFARAANTVVISAPVGDPFGDKPQRILREAYAALGYTAVFRKLPYARALKDSNAGLYDGELSRIVGLEYSYRNLIRIPVPIFYIRLLPVSGKGGLKFKEWDDFSNLRVAYVRGIRLIETRLPVDAVSVAVSSMEKAVELVHEERADVTLLTDLQITQLLGNGAYQGLHVADAPIAQMPLYHYVHKKRRGLARSLEAVLRKMEGNGRIKAILSRD